jgi:hypothetical protein
LVLITIQDLDDEKKEFVSNALNEDLWMETSQHLHQNDLCEGESRWGGGRRDDLKRLFEVLCRERLDGVCRGIFWCEAMGCREINLIDDLWGDAVRGEELEGELETRDNFLWSKLWNQEREGGEGSEKER